MKKLLYGLLSIILALAVFVACAPQPAPTPSPPTPTPTPTPTPEAPYYQGKRIEIVVSSAPGGGTDMCARVAANFLPKHIPGNPEIVVSNQPGGAGAVAHKVFYEGARPDGLTLIQSDCETISHQMAKGPAIGYDLTKYKPIGNIVRSQSVLIIKKGERARLTDPSAKPIQVGSRQGRETWLSMVLWGKEFLGWNVNVVPGYGGTSEVEMSFRRPGEVEMFATSNALVVNRLLEEDLAEIICCQTPRPDFPGIPTFEEMLGDKKPTGLPWQAYVTWCGTDLVDKYLAAPPGTPDDIVAILVEAFTKMSKDPEFDQMMKQRVSEAYSVKVGQETADIINSLLTVPPEVLDYMKELRLKAGIIAE